MMNSYCILDPTRPEPRFAGKCALAVMAKAPRPGRVKTRLSPPLAAEQACELNACFLRDTIACLEQATLASPAEWLISYTPAGEEAAFSEILPPGSLLLSQRGDGFGERLLTTAQDFSPVASLASVSSIPIARRFPLRHTSTLSATCLLPGSVPSLVHQRMEAITSWASNALIPSSSRRLPGVPQRSPGRPSSVLPLFLYAWNCCRPGTTSTTQSLLLVCRKSSSHPQAALAGGIRHRTRNDSFRS